MTHVRRSNLSEATLLLAVLTLACARGEPRLELEDRHLEFRPGLFNYDVNRGWAYGGEKFANFGDTRRTVHPTLEMAPIDENPDDDGITGDDDPDSKLRVRLTLSDASSNPSGDVVVVGEQDELVRDGSGVVIGVATKEVQETVRVAAIGTHTTSTYFDRVLEVTTTGLGVDSTLEVEWWDGHEQEMDVFAPIAGVTESECLDYAVRFNGQEALADWNPTLRACVGALLAGHRLRDGQIEDRVYLRGMYFGLDASSLVPSPCAPGLVESDSIYSYLGSAVGHVCPPATRPDWLATLPSGSHFFEVGGTEDDPRVRPILVELVRRSDGAVVDAARWLLTIAEGASGDPWLVSMDPELENPGLVAQLSRRGLERLEATHASTLPYPIAPAGTQPRLSERAIELPSRRTTAAEVGLDELPPGDLAYFTEENPARGKPEFAGYLAYRAALLEAREIHAAGELTQKLCNSSPPLWIAACKAVAAALNCVDSPPKPEDFRLHVDGVDTFFDPARPLDALAIGEVTRMDLAFVRGTIEADFFLEDIQGWLKGTIDPSRVSVQWDRPVGDPCVVKPRDRVLSDHLEDALDREGWLTCDALAWASPQASLQAPLSFDVANDGESLRTPYLTTSPSILLTAPDVSTGTGACSQVWLHDAVTDALLAWGPSIASAIEVELVTTPGEDETLARLLSPFELGIERVDAPPAGTPPYLVHPLDTYDLVATIGETPDDLDSFSATARHGLHVPYLTRSIPEGASPYEVWFCPAQPGQACDGLPGTHPSMLENGLDDANEPFDVALHLTTAHLSQALWAQSNRPDRLGSESDPARLSLAGDAVPALAASLGFDDVVEALAAHGTAFGVRFHEAAAPFALVNDGFRPGLVYVVPQVEIELVTSDPSGEETVVAKFVADAIDDDLQVKLGTGGASRLSVDWKELHLFAVTTSFLPECPGSVSGVSCAQRLATVVGLLWWPAVQGTLLELVAATPAPQLFDAGQESPRPRQLENARAFVGDAGLTLVGDLCNPQRNVCE